MSPEELRELKLINQRLEALERKQPEVGRWMDWTPTVTQSGAVTVTISFARYCIINKTAHLRAFLTATSAGTANNAIVVSGVPTIATAANGSGIAGVMYVSDAGTAVYVGALLLASTTSFVGRVHNAPINSIGQTPNFALASNDLILIEATYEVA